VITGANGLTLDNVSVGMDAAATSGAFTATTTGGSITIGTVTSSGTQTITSAQGLTFSQLTTTGLAGDDGTVIITATNGPINGTAIAANGSIIERGVFGGAVVNGSLTTATGNITVQSRNNISIGTINSAGRVSANATQGSLAINSAASVGNGAYTGLSNVQIRQAAATGVNSNLSFIATKGGVQIVSTAIAGRGITMTAANGTAYAQALVAQTGSVSVSAGSSVTLNSVSSALRLAVTSTKGAVTVQSSISGGRETLTASTDVTFGQLVTVGVTDSITHAILDPGDVVLSSAKGAVTGTLAQADGSVRALRASSINIGSVVAQTGFVSLSATNALVVKSVQAATTMALLSARGAITVGTALTGGSETIHAAGNITETSLTTTGVTVSSTYDPGDITLVSDSGNINGGSITANGRRSLTGPGTVHGTNF